MQNLWEINLISFCFYFVRLSNREHGARMEGQEGNMT